MKVFRCEVCDSKQKISRGCVKPFKKKTVWTIDECIFCNGEEKKCKYCKGKGKIFVSRCPRAYHENEALLPYFYAYRTSNNLQWPDGRGRLYQPIKLVMAFDIWSFYFNKFDNENAKRAVESAKKTSCRTSTIK